MRLNSSKNYNLKKSCMTLIGTIKLKIVIGNYILYMRYTLCTYTFIYTNLHHRIKV